MMRIIIVLISSVTDLNDETESFSLHDLFFCFIIISSMIFSNVALKPFKFAERFHKKCDKVDGNDIE